MSKDEIKDISPDRRTVPPWHRGLSGPSKPDGKGARRMVRTVRSGDYRKRFLESRPGPWHCRYCNRRIPDEHALTVDHVVPVAAVRGNGLAPRLWRRILAAHGVEDINDGRNLVPACRRCNSRKGQRTGIWIARALLGRYRIWWALRAVFYAAVVAALLFLLWRFVQDPEAAYHGSYAAFRHLVARLP